ncbi:phage tail tape measure protein, partial [Clostridium sp. ZBS18]
MGGLDEQTKKSAAATLFGKEAMSGMLSVINASDADYNKLYENLTNADGAAKKTADTMQDNLKGK